MTFVRPELFLPHTSIFPRLLDELQVRATLNDRTLFNNKEQVCSSDGAQAMSDESGYVTFAYVGKGGLYFSLRIIVQSRRNLVEQDDLRCSEQ